MNTINDNTTNMITIRFFIMILPSTVLIDFLKYMNTPAAHILLSSDVVIYSIKLSNDML